MGNVAERPVQSKPRRSKVASLLAQLGDALDQSGQSEGEAAASRWMRASSSPLGSKLVRQLVRDGVLAASRPSKHLLVDREQHDAWIAAHDKRSVESPETDGNEELDPAILGRG